MAAKPKLGISLRSLARDASDFEERLTEISCYQPDSIELSCFAQDLIFNKMIIVARAEKMRKSLDDFGIPATMHGPLSFNLLDRAEHLEEHIAIACCYIDLGSILGVSAMVIHSGYCPEAEASTLSRKYAAQRDGLKKIADYAAPLGIMIYLENIFPFFEGAHTALPERMGDEITLIDHPQLAGCFDVSHAYIACNAYGAELTQQAKAISPLAPHWHVHDSFGRPLTTLNPYTQSEQIAYGIGDLHLSVGDGDLPWDNVLAVSELSQELTFNIELHPELWSEMSSCVDATRRLIATASNLKAA